MEGNMKKSLSHFGVLGLAVVFAIAWGVEAQAPPASADSRVMVES
jgi:hypothetical protein